MPLLTKNKDRNPQRSQGEVGRKIVRYPTDYIPGSTAEVDTERLPPLSEYADMELAYRQEVEGQEELIRHATRWMYGVTVGSVLLAMCLIFCGPLLSLTWSAPVALGIGVVWSYFSKQKKLKRVFLPLGVLLTVNFSYVILRDRMLFSFLFGFFTLALMLVYDYGSLPFQFYREWLSTEPRLKSETRKRILKQRSVGPNYPLLLLILAITIIVPTYSISLAIVLIFFVCFLSHLFGSVGPVELLRLARNVLGPYLGYLGSHGGPYWFGFRIRGLLFRIVDAHFEAVNFKVAPGVWFPAYPVEMRRVILMRIVLSLYLTLAIGLSLYFPTDLLSRIPSESVIALEQQETLGIKPYTAVKVAAESGVYFLWLLPVSLALSMMLPPFVLLSVYRRAIIRAEGLREEIQGVPGVKLPLDEDGRCEWQWYVDRVSKSQHIAFNSSPVQGVRPLQEAEHFFMGFEEGKRFPILLDKRILREHVHIRGRSGSGKTSRGVIPILTQLIRGHVQEGGSGGIGATGTSGPNLSPPCPIVIIDLKGDMALFQTAREEAEKRGQEFQFFTTEKAKASHYFNPFQNFSSESRTVTQLCELLIQSLNLSHGQGEGHGSSYYSRQNRMALLAVLKAHQNIRTFGELYEKLKALRKIDPQIDPRDIGELIATVSALQSYPQLVTTQQHEKELSHMTIHMPTVIEKSQVVYFWLPSALEVLSVKEIAKLAIFSLYTAKLDRRFAGKDSGANFRQAYLIIDEFQRVAGEHFDIVLQQVRSFDIGAILINQAESDLRISQNLDLRPMVNTNTALKLYFSLTDPTEMENLVKSSGEEIAVLQDMGVSQVPGRFYSEVHHTTYTYKETFKPRLTSNDLIRISNDPELMIFHASGASGYTQFGGYPIPVRTMYAMSKDVYNKRYDGLWPTKEEYGLEDTVISTKEPAQVDQEAYQALIAEHERKLADLGKKKKEKEGRQ